ncbi:MULTISPECIES: glutaminase [unclassified Flavobacterium]|uniref:glutaminase n=1 Tax=unclassified Flavobacterium TaxID=196869 RepID=UPI0012923E31|nr:MULTISPECIES: glutaminase [unclassified Flavobacterium]MQP52904.1 glutaminase [Flavobacterium sp. LMO9]MQP63207.1 glutaminase [Flavobacterium sp. LMO6]
MPYQDILDGIYNEVSQIENTGKIADYIPELAKIDENKYGIALIDKHQNVFSKGDALESFSIQSISKVITTSLIFSKIGNDLWKRVGYEPSGNAFNSLIQLEYEKGIPRNPFINAGALVIADLMLDHFENPKEYFLEFVRELSENPTINYNQKVVQSELENGYRNAALVNFIKSFDNIKHQPEEVLDFYYHQCSVEMSCVDLAKCFQVFANNGIIPKSNSKFLTSSQCKRMNALMQMCGFYDQAGEFTFKVGLPGKSGVGGGVVAIFPNQYTVAVWSPKLNKKGNSFYGLETLERLTTITETSIF